MTLVGERSLAQPQSDDGAGGNSKPSLGADSAAAGPRLSPEHRNKLASSALPAAQIEQLKAAGFRTDTSGRLVIPYRNPDGTPQLMPDGSAWERLRLPQAEIEANPKGPKYRSKKGAGCRLYHPVLSPDHANRLADPKVALRFTEGELKGEACAFHDPDRVTIALGGVDCWRDSRSGESAPLPELEALELRNREVRLCWDSDVSKPSVRKALAKFSIWLATEKKAHVLMERLPNAPERDSKGKVIRLGADDLINGYGADGFRRICSELAEPCIVWKEDKEGRRIPSFVMAHDPEPGGKDATFVRSVYLTALLGRLWQSDPEKGDSWRRWTGTHWQRIDGTDPINAAVERFLDCQGWRVARERHNVAGLVAAFRRQINPAADTSTAAGLLPFANGCLRLADGVFLPHDAAHGNTWALPFGYEPEATSSATEAFLSDRLGDPASVAVFRAFARALLVGDRLKCFLEITGPSNTGKSVLANVLQALVGTANTAAGTLQRIEDRTQRFETIKLRGKRLAVFSECQDFAGQLQVLKALTGGDPIPAEVKGGRHFDFTFGGGVVLVGNGPIRATDPTGAVINRRRSLLVTKVVAASAERQLLDPDGYGGWRGDLAAELPGLVNWALAMPAAEARAALARDVCSPARAEAELEALLSTDLLADWADQHLIWEPDAMPLRVGTATGNTANPDTFLFPSYLRFVEAQGRNTRPLSLKVFRSKLIDLLRDTLQLPLPPDSSDAYRMRSLGSVVPCLRWRSDGLQDAEANGVIRSAFLARLKTQQGTDGTDAERIGNGKTPVGNGWNGWNGSSPYSPIGKPASEPSYRGSSAPQPVPAVPSVPHKGSCRSAPVPDPFPSVPQGVPVEVQNAKTGEWEPGWRQLATGSGSGSLLCSDPRGQSRQVQRKRIRRALNAEAT